MYPSDNGPPAPDVNYRDLEPSQPAAPLPNKSSSGGDAASTFGPTLPTTVQMEEIEGYLDRIALAVATSPHGQDFLPLYLWLEAQLEKRRRDREIMSLVMDRVRRLQGRRGAPS